MFLLFLLFFQFTFAGSICNDGTYSESEGRGTCSWHGGVKEYPYIPSSRYQDSYLPERKVDTTYEIEPNVKSKWESSSSSSNIELPAEMYEASIATYTLDERGAVNYFCLSENKKSALFFRYDNGYRYKTNLQMTSTEAKKEGINLNVKFEFTTSDGQAWEYPMENAVVYLGEKQLKWSDDDDTTWQVSLKVGPKLIAQLKDSTSISVFVLGDGFTVTYERIDAWIAIDTANRLCLRN